MARRGRGARAHAETRATRALASAGVPFELHAYDVDPDAAAAGSLGEAAAAALGVPAEHVFKSLVAEVDGRPVCAVVPASGSLSLKALAAAAGGKRARMADAPDAERLTGYVTGGISPFAQTRTLPTFVDGAALGLESVYVSAGQRGLQVSVAPRDLVALTRATPVDGLAAD